MSRDLVISGAGKGGGGHQPVEYDDTLSAKQRIRLLYLINDCEIEQVEDVLLNGVSYQEFDVDYDVRLGTPDQTIINGFSFFENPLQPFTAAELPSTAPYLTPSLQKSTDAVRVTLLLDALLRVKDNGDRVGYSVSFSFYVRNVTQNGIWTLVKSVTKTGKASSKYAFDVRIDWAGFLTLADTDQWQLRVQRDTPDDDTDQLKSTSNIGAVTEIQDFDPNDTDKFRYPGKALVFLVINDAAQFGGRIPEVIFKSKLSKLYIPTGYDPIDRTYTDPWDGSFQTAKAYTDNPAWAIYNVLSRHESGLDLDPSDVDAGSFYQLSKYCDELVDDGNGGLEPRFRIDVHFQLRYDTKTFLQHLLSVCRATLIENAYGQIAVAFDSDQNDIEYIVTNADVENGYFGYQSTPIEDRKTVTTVTFNDRENLGRTNTADYPAEDLLVHGIPAMDRYGYEETDLVSKGTTRESQATRQARWNTYTGLKQTQILTWTSGFYGNFFKRQSLALVMDSQNTSDKDKHFVVTDYSKQTGLNKTTITLDRTMTLSAAGVNPQTGNYTVSVLDADAKTVHKKVISETDGDFTELTLTNGELDLYVGVPGILEGEIIARTVKITDKEQDPEKKTWKITAIEHDDGKFAFVETGYSTRVRSGSYIDFAGFATETPVNLAVAEFHASDATHKYSRLQVSWDWDTDSSEKYKVTFVLQYARDSGEFITVYNLTVNSFDIENPIPGVYAVRLIAVSLASGVRSKPATLDYNYRVTPGASTLSPPVNVRVKGSAGTVFDTPDCYIAWDYNTVNDAVAITDALNNYKLEIVDLISLAVVATFYIEPDDNKNGEKNFLYSENVNAFGSAQRQFRVRLYSRDLGGDFSNYVETIFTNPVPAVTDFSVAAGIDATYVSINKALEGDAAGYVIHRDTVSGFTPSLQNLIYEGPDNYVALSSAQNTQYYYRVAVFDTFGTIDLNYSAEKAVATQSLGLDRFVFAGLDFTPAVHYATVQRTAGYDAWDAFANTKIGFSRAEESCVARMRVTVETLVVMVGLTVNPDSGQSHTNINHALYVQGNFNLQIYEAGTFIGDFGTVQTGDLLEVYYNHRSGFVTYYLNETNRLRITAAANGDKFYGACAIYSDTKKGEFLEFTQVKHLAPSNFFANVRDITDIVVNATDNNTFSVLKSGVIGWQSLAQMTSPIQGAYRITFTVTDTAVRALVGTSLQYGSSATGDVIDGLKFIGGNVEFHGGDGHTANGTVLSTFQVGDVFEIFLDEKDKEVVFFKNGLKIYNYVTFQPVTQDRFVTVLLYETTGQGIANLKIEPANWTQVKSNIDWEPYTETITTVDNSNNGLAWSSGSVSKNGAALQTINAGQVIADTFPLFVYYDESASLADLRTTTQLTQSVAGDVVMAVYRGGFDLVVSEGKPTIDGNNVLAGTVGAKQLVADRAVITSTLQVAEAIVQNQHISGFIESTNFSYNPGQYASGFNLDKDTGQLTINQLLVVDAAGNVVMSSNTGLEWDYLNNRPSDSAIYNNQISLNVDGTLNNAGGGQVTLPGIGQQAYRVVSAGGFAAGNSPLGVYCHVQYNGTTVFSGGRSYSLVRINRSTGVIDFTQTYDVYGNAANAGALATHLNQTGPDHIVIVVSWDEPFTNRLTNGLPEALYRCGASRAVFGSSQFKTRSSYILIGIPGCGEGNGAEAYQGSVNDDPDAWCELSFTVSQGTLTGVSANYRPRTLDDYGYTGDLNANFVDNTNQLTDGAGLGSTAIWNSITGAGKPDSYADVTASNPQSPAWLTSAVPWSGNKISSGNIGTFMQAAAILEAFIGDLQVTTGKIGFAQIDTLRVAGDAVRSASFSVATYNITDGVSRDYTGLVTASDWRNFNSITVSVSSDDLWSGDRPIVISFSNIDQIIMTNSGGNDANLLFRIVRDGVVVYGPSYNMTSFIDIINSVGNHTYTLQVVGILQDQNDTDYTNGFFENKIYLESDIERIMLADFAKR